jgi:hypothetical protein
MLHESERYLQGSDWQRNSKDDLNSNDSNEYALGFGSLANIGNCEVCFSVKSCLEYPADLTE